MIVLLKMGRLFGGGGQAETRWKQGVLTGVHRELMLVGLWRKKEEEDAFMVKSISESMNVRGQQRMGKHQQSGLPTSS